MNKAPFWKRVRIGTPEQCWLWMGARLNAGYGVTQDVNRKQVGTHRLAWELTFGPIPKGVLILHKCDNPPCCNPWHLFPGSHRDNTQDAFRKGRLPKLPSHFWPNNPRSKLNPSIASKIRKLRAKGVGVRALGRQFGVSHPTIRLILSNQTYAV